MILILGSVPDFLTNILPFFFIILFAFLIATLHLFLFITSLFFTVTFSKICGIGLNTFNSLLAFLFFLNENRTSNATSRPSPVVANFPSIICPDCSPPKLNFFFSSFL